MEKKIFGGGGEGNGGKGVVYLKCVYKYLCIK